MPMFQGIAQWLNSIWMDTWSNQHTVWLKKMHINLARRSVHVKRTLIPPATLHQHMEIPLKRNHNITGMASEKQQKMLPSTTTGATNWIPFNHLCVVAVAFNIGFSVIPRISSMCHQLNSPPPPLLSLQWGFPRQNSWWQFTSGIERNLILIRNWLWLRHKYLISLAAPLYLLQL